MVVLHAKIAVLICFLIFTMINMPMQNYSSYYFAEGCLSGKRFVFGYVVDGYSNFKYATYQQNTFDLDARCINNAKNCATDGTGNGNGNGSKCPRNAITSTCTSDFNNRCQMSGLYSEINNIKLGDPLSIYSSACDFINNQQDPTSQDFTNKCFTWFGSTFFTGSMTFNTLNMENIDSQMYTSSQRLRLLRFLQVNNNIQFTDSDPSLNDPTSNQFKNITLNGSTVNVDGSLANNPRAPSQLLLDLQTANSNNIIPTTNPNGTIITVGSSFLNLSCFIVLVVSFVLF